MLNIGSWKSKKKNLPKFKRENIATWSSKHNTKMKSGIIQSLEGLGLGLSQ